MLLRLGSSASADSVIPERRNGSRFPIEREMRYRVGNKGHTTSEGVGRTLNISSSGILFTSSDAALRPGKRIEVSINWPARLDKGCHLRLAARGRISRIVGNEIAVEVEHYEFRTAAHG